MESRSTARTSPTTAFQDLETALHETLVLRNVDHHASNDSELFKLPSELMGSIADLSDDVATLQALRLTCSILKTACTSSFAKKAFGLMSVSLEMDSLHRFHQVSSAEWAVPHIKVLQVLIRSTLTPRRGRDSAKESRNQQRLLRMSFENLALLGCLDLVMVFDTDPVSSTEWSSCLKSNWRLDTTRTNSSKA